MQKIKIAVVIVTYNRKKMLEECLHSILMQSRMPDGVYVVDNASSDGTEKLFSEKFQAEGEIRSIDSEHKSDGAHNFYFTEKSVSDGFCGYYLRLSKNTGGAGGFHLGIKMAMKDGFDWVLVMDDDAELEVQTIKKLDEFLNKSSGKEKIAALACKKVDHKGRIEKIHRGYFNSLTLRTSALSVDRYNINEKIPIDYASFVGLLINSDAIKSSGLPVKEYFIYCDDVEYCLRLKKYGLIYLVPESVIVHKDRIISKDNSFWQDIPVKDYWKRYYGIRNLTCFSMQHFSAGLFKTFIMILVPRMVKTVLTQKNTRTKLFLLWKGWIHGVRGKMNVCPEDVRNISFK